MSNLNDPLLRVLLVEDSQLTADQIREVLSQLPVPFEVRTVQTQNDAFSMAQEFNPDVVVVDLQLKQGTGFGVLKGLAYKDPKPNFIVLTNYALPNYRNYALLAGADYFLDKAKDISVLPFIIESIARNRTGALVDEVSGE